MRFYFSESAWQIMKGNCVAAALSFLYHRKVSYDTFLSEAVLKMYSCKLGC